LINVDERILVMTLVFTMLSASVDGYVSGRNARPGAGLGDGGQIFDWFSNGDYPSREYPNMRLSPPNAAVIDFHGTRVGAFVSGRTTYEHADRWGGDSPKPGVPLFVLSREPIPDADPRQTIVTDGIESAIEEAKAVAEKAGKDVAVVSGATVTEALKAGLLDEIVINQRPVLLGGGHPFFRELPDAIQLECTSVAVNSGVVHLTYRVLK
jgi:dihydrofolate reductase